MLISAATHDYARGLNLLLDSYRRTNPGKPARVFLLNWPPSYIRLWRNRYPDFCLDDYKLPATVYRERTRRNKYGSILKLKPGLILKAYNETEEPVIWIDADTLVTRALDPIMARVSKEGDLGVTKRCRSAEYLRYAVAVICTVRTARGAKSLSDYAYETENNAGLNLWFYDQIGMARLEDKYDYKLVSLTDDEHTICGTRTSAIISARKRVNLARVYKEVFKNGQ